MPLFRRIERPRFLVKILNFEYWKWWMFFIPMLPLWLWYALKMRSLVWFTAANPAIEYGGFFGESKIDILHQIPDKYKPITLYFKEIPVYSQLLEVLKDKKLDFPLILKPNIGERGDDVEVVRNQEELAEYLTGHTEALIIQEYVDFDIELGILYHKMPSANKGKISSVVLKEFMTVCGNGHQTIRELLQNNTRASFQMERWEEEKPELLNKKLAKGETEIVERIGNHCLGTKFLDHNEIINSKLEECFDEIVKDYEGFCYGRFDLKVSSVEELYRGEGIKIFELNGVSAEPGHIYDPKHHLLFAYKELFKHWTYIYAIARENVKQGFKLPSWKEVYQVGREHFGHKKSLS